MDNYESVKMRFVLIALMRSAITGEKITEDVRRILCSAEVLSAIMRAAIKHDIGYLVSDALIKNELVDKNDAAYAKIKESQINAAFRYERMKYDFGVICSAFNEAGIYFIPLKGAVIRKYYPDPLMRTSCDIDVLVKEEQLSAAAEALQNKGWRKDDKVNYHDISLFSPANTHLELHFNLREHIPEIDAVLDRVWEHIELYPEEEETAQKSDTAKESADNAAGTYRYRQTDEFLMFHLLAHMSYHFVSGGCGLRSFADIFILREKLAFDEEKLNALLCEGHIKDFYGQVLALIDVWFYGKPHTDLTRRMEKYVIDGGVYGTLTNRVSMEQAKHGGKGKNLKQRIFMPYDKLKERYPVLVKHKWLTPLYEVVRWFSLLKRDTFKRSVNELKANNAVSARAEDMTEFLKDVGLKHMIKAEKSSEQNN